jgi:hypothetical protein
MVTWTKPTGCSSDPWPSQLNGQGSRDVGLAKGFYLSVDPSTGIWTLEDTHKVAHTLVDFTGTITTDGTLGSLTPIRLEKTDSVSVSSDKSTLTFFSHNEGFTDGVSFVPTKCNVTFQGSVNGHPVPTTDIYLGSPATHPGTKPVTFTRT